MKFITCFALGASALPAAEKPDTWPPHPREKAATARWMVKNIGVSFVHRTPMIGVGKMLQRFFDDILISRTNSNGAYRVDL